ncbi:MAG: quinone-dependent dihydroorotate dehydrogenase [Flavisolibacter sp.]
MYKILRTILFLFPAETAHYISMNSLKLLCSIALIRRLLARVFKSDLQAVKVFGLNFRNRVGMAAGFDKNARYLRELNVLGFGFVEIGTVTPRPQKGNNKPRLFRLPGDKALINRMGFNNDGADKIAQRLKAFRKDVNRQSSIVNVNRKSSIVNVNRQSSIVNEDVNRQSSIVNDRESDIVNREAATSNQTSSHQRSAILIGGNIGKNKSTPNEEAWKDYEICFRALHPYVDFFVVNVSSPNTPGLRELQEREALKKILTHLQALNSEMRMQRPLILKIAPDLNQSQLDDIIDLALEIKLDGIVATNTTIDRSSLRTSTETLDKIGAGGLSGAPLKKRSTEVVAYLDSRIKGSMSVIASGGIFTALDVQEKINAGASLIEVYTGFIYEGPFIVHKLCKNFQVKVRRFA